MQIDNMFNVSNNQLKTKRSNLSFRGIPSNVFFLQDINKDINIAMSWSGGKDSAFALHKILENPKIHLQSLFTIFSDSTKRVSLSGLREDLLDKQINSLKINIPFKKIFVKNEGSMEGYNQTLEEITAGYKKEGIDTILYGNTVYNPKIFEDANRYITQRVELFKKWGMKVLFPFSMSEELLQKDIVKNNFKPIIAFTSKDLPHNLVDDFLGKTVDKKFLDEIPNLLPEEQLPFNKLARTTHTFTYAGPIFKEDIQIETGKKLETDFGKYIEIIPVKTNSK